MSRRLPFLFLSAFVLLVLMTTSRADAQVSHGDLGLSFGPELILHTAAKPTAVGTGLRLGAAWGIHPLWNIGATGSLGRVFAPESGYLTGSLYGGTTLMMDVVSVVPWAGIGLGLLVEPKPGERTPLPWLSAEARIGLDYRPRRAWSFGFEANLRTAFASNVTKIRQVGLALRFTWMRSRMGI